MKILKSFVRMLAMGVGLVVGTVLGAVLCGLLLIIAAVATLTHYLGKALSGSGRLVLLACLRAARRLAGRHEFVVDGVDEVLLRVTPPVAAPAPAATEPAAEEAVTSFAELSDAVGPEAASRIDEAGEKEAAREEMIARAAATGSEKGKGNNEVIAEGGSPAAPGTVHSGQ